MSNQIKMFGVAVASAAVILTIPGSVHAQRSGRSDVNIWAQTCSNCHANQPRSKYESVKWEAIMVHMQLVARLTDDETQAVLRYLKRGARTEDQAAASEAQAESTDSGGASDGMRAKDPAIPKSKPTEKATPPRRPGG